jgi:hypothetical protein
VTPRLNNYVHTKFVQLCITSQNHATYCEQATILDSNLSSYELQVASDDMYIRSCVLTFSVGDSERSDDTEPFFLR